jgi:Peptidase family S41
MPRPWTLLLLLSLCLMARAEARKPTPGQANVQDFDFIVAKITANYAGYETKVTDKTRPALTELTDRLREKARLARNDEELAAVLKEWVDFFQDKHTFVEQVATMGGVVPKVRTLALTEASAKAQLEKLGRSRVPAEGLWVSGQERFAVVRTDTAGKQLAAVVLTSDVPAWTTGQVRAEFTVRADGAWDVRYVNRHLLPVAYRGRTTDGHDILEFTGTPARSWRREWPEAADPIAFDKRVPSGDLFLRRLSPRTLWLRLPDFKDRRAEPLAKLLADHKAELDRTDNLVIDARRHGGGSDYVYAPLLPLLYSRPIYSISLEMKVTRDNIDTLAAAFAATKMPDVQRARLEAYLKGLEPHLGKWFRDDGKEVYVEAFPSVLPFPKRVAILIDDATSSGEQFLLAARQSRKVTLFGQRNSLGMLDFSNITNQVTPSGRFKLHWATSRTLRLPGDPVDPHGIPPDLRIPVDVTDPVGYAQAWLERQVD